MIKIKMMNLVSGKMIMTKMKIRLNIGSREIKWIKLLKFTITWILSQVGKVLSFGSILRGGRGFK